MGKFLMGVIRIKTYMALNIIKRSKNELDKFMNDKSMNRDDLNPVLEWMTEAISLLEECQN